MSRSHKRPGWTECGRLVKRWSNRDQRRVQDYLWTDDYYGDLDLRKKLHYYGVYRFYRNGYRNKQQIRICVEQSNRFYARFQSTTTPEEECKSLYLWYLCK